jgi:putative FmdB family regulatory protein
MPLYEFHCNDCNRDFESLMKPYDPVSCPHCKHQDCTKLLSPIGRYKIRGDNDASTTPERYRGEKKK